MQLWVKLALYRPQDVSRAANLLLVGGLGGLEQSGGPEGAVRRDTIMNWGHQYMW